MSPVDRTTELPDELGGLGTEEPFTGEEFEVWAGWLFPLLFATGGAEFAGEGLAPLAPTKPELMALAASVTPAAAQDFALQL